MRSPEGLALRVATAAALLGAFLAALLLLEGRTFAALVAAVLGLAAHEWGRLSGFTRPGAAAYGAAVALLTGALAWSLDAAGPLGEFLLAAASLFWLVAAPIWLYAGLGGATRAMLALAGLVTLALAGVAVASLSASELLLVLGFVWIADTAAYFTGKAYGRRPLAPTLSPGKTWEGAAGAAVATLAYAIVCALPWAPLGRYIEGTAWIAYAGAALLLCAVGIVGDLFESALKRRAGVKDSGALLPGHGGILDRIDSVMSTLPVAALLLHWIGRP